MDTPNDPHEVPQGAENRGDKERDQTTDHAPTGGSCTPPFKEGDHVALTAEFWWCYPGAIKSRFGGQLTIARWTCSGWVVKNARGEELAAVPTSHLEHVRPQFWWCGWTVPHFIPESAYVKTWPAQMHGWDTGMGFDFDNWCGLVWARTEDEVWEIIRSCYTTQGDQIGPRWTPDPCGETWEPGERFQLTEATIMAMKVAR